MRSVVFPVSMRAGSQGGLLQYTILLTKRTAAYPHGRSYQLEYAMQGAYAHYRFHNDALHKSTFYLLITPAGDEKG